VTVDPTQQPTDTVAVFPGSAVVELVTGDAHSRDAMVVDVHHATVQLTVQQLSATDGERSWAWLLSDVSDVVHSADEPWTIISVPGVTEFGVSVPLERVQEFRTTLDRLLSERSVRWADDQSAVASVPAPPPMPPPPLLIAPSEVDGSASLSQLATAPDGAPITNRVPVVAASTTAAARPPSGLDAHNISAWFGDHQVLDRVSLSMQAGQVTSLIGPSGCGKSTFLRILNRMHEMIPSASLAGEVLLEGHDIYDPDRKLTDARREIGMVFQKPNPFPAMSIYDNCVASLQLTGTKASAAVKDELVETCLSKAGLWNEVKDRLRAPGGGLSGGQQQRLCIARALAIKPRVLLMDEPCSALDPTSTRRIEETIVELAAEVTIVIVTHNMQQAARVSDYCAFFLATQGTPGIIVEHGPTEAMFGSPQDERTADYVHGRFG
jgi:phosphate transport system ATP-binding protein